LANFVRNDLQKEAQSEEESHDDLPLSTLKINVQCGKPGIEF